MGKAGLLLVAVVLAVAGLLAYLGRTTSPQGPNDLETAGVEQAKQMRAQLASAYQQLERRVVRGEIDDAERSSRMKGLAGSFADKVNLEAIPDASAFDYGEVFRTAERWKDARALFTLARDKAPNDDIRVNANLRIAHCSAALGEFAIAAEAIRATFDAPPGNKAGVLLATLYEVTPLLRAKGHDADLARLLEEAIQQHRRTVIDPKTEAGQAFLMAMPTHVRNGWIAVIGLYRDAGEMDEAARASRDADRMLAAFARA